MRTCWLAIQEFRLVATSLRRRYDGATRVQVAQDSNRLVVANRNHKKPTRSDLIYLEQSPDFCDFDPHAGQSLGVITIIVSMVIILQWRKDYCQNRVRIDVGSQRVHISA